MIPYRLGLLTLNPGLRRSHVVDDLVKVARAIVAALNGRRFSQAFTAVRAYAPVYKLEDLGTLHVTVAPRAHERTRLTRGRHEGQPQIDVAVQKRISASATTAAANTELDALRALVREISLFLLPNSKPRRYAGAAAMSIDNDPIHDFARLRVHNQFTSVLTVNLSKAQ